MTALPNDTIEELIVALVNDTEGQAHAVLGTETRDGTIAHCCIGVKCELSAIPYLFDTDENINFSMSWSDRNATLLADHWLATPIKCASWNNLADDLASLLYSCNDNDASGRFDIPVQVLCRFLAGQRDFSGFTLGYTLPQSEWRDTYEAFGNESYEDDEDEES